MEINEDEIKQQYESYLKSINSENERIRRGNFELSCRGEFVFLKPWKIISYEEYKKEYIESIKQLRR